MVAYEIYLSNKMGRDELLGILPERRKIRKRITRKSVLRWGKMLLPNNCDGKRMFVKTIRIDDNSGKLFVSD
jgi:hypothetical protein